MHQHYEKAHEWTKEAINAALEVHSQGGRQQLNNKFHYYESDLSMHSKTFAILCDLEGRRPGC